MPGAFSTLVGVFAVGTTIARLLFTAVGKIQLHWSTARSRVPLFPMWIWRHLDYRASRRVDPQPLCLLKSSKLKRRGW